MLCAGQILLRLPAQNRHRTHQSVVIGIIAPAIFCGRF